MKNLQGKMVTDFSKLLKLEICHGQKYSSKDINFCISVHRVAGCTAKSWNEDEFKLYWLRIST